MTFNIFRIRTEMQPQFPSDTLPSKKRLVAKILIFRLLFLLGMAVSCSLIPDHNPGDGVLRFDLRLGKEGERPCFCLPEQSCANYWTSSLSLDCGRETPKNAWTVSLIPTAAWKFCLSPLTKWDAARFLHLAVRSSLRDPPKSCQEVDVISANCDFSDSEQAHAFFPFYPMLLQNLALLWIRWAPTAALLPPTFECLVVVMGLVLNVACLLVATLSLYSLTMSILPISPDDDDDDKKSYRRRQQLATAVCMVYGIWNPASVFFATNYSESLFGALTLMGHALFAQQKYWLSIPLWMIASFTRSNGSIHCIWLLLQALGYACSFISKANKSTSSFLRAAATITSFVGGAILIFLPVRYHDKIGYARHCERDFPIKPSWCQETHASSSFSLYGWTQQRHWNVGMFRYYELKQIPNFLLAAPILALSTLGVVLWIRNSMLVYGKGKLPRTLYMLLLGWPIRALADSVTNNQPSNDPTTPKVSSVPAAYDYLVYNPRILGHYAILAGLALVGLVVAHVQISTRMICSSSPAVIWFLTWCHIQEESVRLRQFVGIYTGLFMLLGIILHVNFLPWT